MIEGDHKLTPHTFIMPYAEVLLGRTREYILYLEFEYGGEEEDGTLKIHSVTCIDTSKLETNVDHFVEENSTLSLDIIEGILGNKKFWDETKPWW